MVIGLPGVPDFGHCSCFYHIEPEEKINRTLADKQGRRATAGGLYCSGTELSAVRCVCVVTGTYTQSTQKAHSSSTLTLLHYSRFCISAVRTSIRQYMVGIIRQWVLEYVYI